MYIHFCFLLRTKLDEDILLCIVVHNSTDELIKLCTAKLTNTF